MWTNFRNLYFILFDYERYESVAGPEYSPYALPFRAHFFHSLAGAGLAVGIAIILGVITDRIAWNYAPAIGKIAAASGAFLAAWGTWFGVQERQESFKKSRIDEALRDFVFELTFFPGVILGSLGAVW